MPIYHAALGEKTARGKNSVMTTGQTLLFALSLGLGAGLTPGPLSSLVVHESLRNGWKGGACVALAPLVGDVLVVGLVLAVLHQLPSPSFSVLSLIGGCYVCFLGGETLRLPPSPRMGEEGAGSVWLSFRKGLLVNLLNPHPYLFWLTVGGPLVTDHARHNLWVPIMAFLLGFYGCLVGAKVLIAVLVHGGRARLQGRSYRIALRLSGVSLLLFGLLLVWEGASALLS